MKKFLPWLIVVLVACSKKSDNSQPNVIPNAKFTFAGDSANPQPVVFTNLSTSNTPFRWNFGDSTYQTSFDNNPVSHVYADAGTYTVTLTAYSVTDSASYTQTVTVIPVKTRMLGVGFTSTADTTGNYFIDTMPVTIVPNISASGPIKYTVDYGDGTSDTSLVHKYPAGARSYHVKVKAVSKYGSDTSSGDVELFRLGEQKYGGAIFQINSDGHGYVAATGTYTTTLDWGCNNTPLLITDTAMGSGATNTQTIIDSCGTGTIAYYTTRLNIAGFTDWYLPSVIELRTAVPVLGLSMAGNYASSSENDATTYMTDLPVGTGAPVTAQKSSLGNTVNLIPVRRF